MKVNLCVVTIFFQLIMSGAVQAALVDRGGGLVYDTDLDITWMADANYAKTSGYDADGLMTWDESVKWADQLVYGGYDDWRLPITPQTDAGCSIISSGTGFGDGCSGSEMGHLFYVEGVRINSLFFHNISRELSVPGNYYWSATTLGYFPSSAFVFSFANHGDQSSDDKSSNFLSAWAVRSGDVVAVAVPEPSMGWMLTGGLVFLASMYIRRSPVRS